MGIIIGNGNKIKNSVIAENNVIDNTNDKNWCQRHQVLTGIFITIVSGLILSFSFWNKIITYIESWGK